MINKHSRFNKISLIQEIINNHTNTVYQVNLKKLQMKQFYVHCSLNYVYTAVQLQQGCCKFYITNWLCFECQAWSNGPYTTGFVILHKFYLTTTALSASEMSYSYTKHTAGNAQFPLQCSHNKLTIIPEYCKSHCAYTEMSFKKCYLTNISLLVTAVEISLIPNGYNMVHYT